MYDFRYLKSDAIILNTYKYKEADRIVVLLTKEFGKKKCIIKSIRRSNNKFRGNVEPGDIVKVMMYFRRKDIELGKIIDIENIYSLFNIRKSLDKLLALSYILNLVDESFKINDFNKNFFIFFEDFLSNFDRLLNDTLLSLFVRFFELKLLYYIGIHPELNSCSSCGSTINGDIFIISGNLSALCDLCSIHYKNKTKLSKDFIKFYSNILNSNISDLQNIFFNKNINKEAKLFFREIFFNYLGKKIKSLGVLEELL